MLKNTLCKNAGSDPVAFKIKDDSGEHKVLTASMFWVNSSNDLVNTLKHEFKDRIDIDIRSLDAA